MPMGRTQSHLRTHLTRRWLDCVLTGLERMNRTFLCGTFVYGLGLPDRIRLHECARYIKRRFFSRLHPREFDTNNALPG